MEPGELLGSADMAKNSRRNNSFQTGAILVLFTIILSVILAFTALVIDGTLMRLSREQAQHYARLAALGAIEEYFDQSSCPNKSCTADESYERALARAQKVSRTNVLTADASQRPEISEASSTSAILEPGRWETSAAKCNHLPAPCFSPRVKGDNDINAFRLSGTFYSGIATYFSNAVFNKDKYSMTVSATATVTPRRVCFLVDVSATMTGENYPEKDGIRANMAYYLKGFNQEVINLQKGSWDSLVSKYPNRSSSTSTTDHFSDDYKRKWLLDDDMYYYGSVPDKIKNHHPTPSQFPRPQYGADGSWVYFDLYRSQSYSGPEPLTSVMEGLNYAVDLLDKRHVNGDKACVIFYDQNLYWPRIVNMTNDFDYLKEFTNIVDNGWDATTLTEDAQARNASTLINAKGLERLIRHGLFQSPVNFSDAKAALSEAQRQFQADTLSQTDNIPTADSVVVIGDGLHNCTTTWGCDDTAWRHYNAMSELSTYVSNSYVPNAIPIHVMLAGSNVTPYTYNMTSKKYPGECMSDKEYRESVSLPGEIEGYVPGDYHFDDSHYPGSPEHPFTPVNSWWYRIAAASQGVWAPLRPSPSGCTISTSCQAGIRQITDPKCRTLHKQVIDYMTEIIGDNPYTLVELQ